MTSTIDNPSTISNLQSFKSRDLPWAQLGVKLPAGITTASEAAFLGGLDFEVELVDAGYRNPVTNEWESIPHRKAVARKDTGQFYQVVSASDYALVQYGEAFAFMDEIGPQYVAAGTIGDGRQGFIVAKIPEHDRLDLWLCSQSDVHEVFVVLRTSQDMSRALEVNLLYLRNRCMNALALRSFSNRAVQRWSIRHVGNPLEKIREAQRVIRNAVNYENEIARVADDLAETPLTVQDAEEVLGRVLPDKPRRSDNIRVIISSWKGETNGFPGTGWGLVNAVNEFYEWGRPAGLRTPESRFTGNLTGDVKRFTDRTAQIVMANF